MTARQQATALQRWGPGSSSDSADAFPTGGGQSSGSDEDIDVCSPRAQPPTAPPRLTRAAAAAAAARAAAASISEADSAATTSTQTATAATNVPPTATLGTSAAAAAANLDAPTASVTAPVRERALPCFPLQPTAPVVSAAVNSGAISNVADSCRAEAVTLRIPSSSERQPRPSDCESDGTAHPQQIQNRSPLRASLPAEAFPSTNKMPLSTHLGVCTSSFAACSGDVAAHQASVICANEQSDVLAAAGPRQPQPSRSNSSHRTPFDAATAVTADSDDGMEVVSPPPDGWAVRPSAAVAVPAASDQLVAGAAAAGKLPAGVATEKAESASRGPPQPADSAATQPADDEETISVDVGSCLEAGPSATSQLKVRPPLLS